MFVCLECGTKYSLEDARNLISDANTTQVCNSQKVSYKRDDFYYEDEFGLLIKDKLVISPTGILWKERKYPLDIITRLRFGSTLHSVIFAFNVFDVCKTYTVYFGTDSKLLKISAKKTQFIPLVENLWKATAPNVIKNVLYKLSMGMALPLGNIGVFQLRDTGVEFANDWAKEPHLPPLLKWKDLNKIWKFATRSGCLVVCIPDEKTNGEMFFLERILMMIIFQFMNIYLDLRRSTNLID